MKKTNQKEEIIITYTMDEPNRQSLPVMKGDEEPELKLRSVRQTKPNSSIWKRISFDSKSQDFDTASSLLQLENKNLFEKFSQEEISKIASVFKIFNKSKDNILELKEFQHGMGYLSFDTDFLFKSFNKNEPIDATKFLFGMAILLKGSSSERLNFIFHSFCKKGEQVTLKQLEETCSGFFKTLDNINLKANDSSKYASELFSKLDTDKKGYFTFKEFETLAKTNPIAFCGLGHLSSKLSYSENIPPGIVLYPGAKFWNLGIQMMVGIRHSVLMFNSNTKREMKSSDFTATLEFEIPENPLDPKGEPVPFITFAPLVFGKIREMFDVSDDEYALSIGPEQLIGHLQLGKLTSFSQKSSDGKSGSFFFFSHDSKFMAKTISKSEANTFFKVLPAYYKYMKENPDTTLVRLFGIHEIHGEHFLVMGNVFHSPVRIHECYDLKGSTVGRSNKEGFVKKDLDIKKGRFKLTSDEKKKLLAQVKKDTEFLKGLNVIDYSFCVGIHEVKDVTHVMKQITNESIKVSTTIVSDKEVYFIGIIDILTVYDLKKSTEHNLKSFIHQSSQLSAVPAGQYQERFCKFIETCIE